MREPHTLRKTKGNFSPYNWIFFDCETYPEVINENKTINRLKLGVVRYYRKEKDNRLKFQRESIFRDSESLVKFIISCTRSKTEVMIVSHNLSFDFLAGNLFTTIPQYGFRLSSFYKKGMTTIFNYTDGDKSLTAIDSGNFFPSSLEQIGLMVNRPKDRVDFETVDDDTLIMYCRNDVLIIVEALEFWLKFLKANNLGGFKNTIASTAMNVFRRNFMKHKIYLHSDKETINLERESYHGGRTETIHVGYHNSQTFYQLDVNSMYPYICSTNKFPVSKIEHFRTDRLAYLEQKLERYACIARARIKTDQPAYPLLHKGRIFYPIGEFDTVLSTPELEYAFENNHIKSVSEFAIYQQFNIFQDYMNFFYDLRLKYRTEGNEIFDKICKMFGNSLYGKWGAKETKIERMCDNETGKIGIEDDYNIETNIVYDWYYFPDSIFKVWSENVAYNAFPAIASHVTAHGRMMYYRYMTKANRKNVYYGDTDGLWVNAEGFKNLYSMIDDERLGALKIEDTSSFLDIRSPKNYICDNKIKSKGIRKDAIKLDENTFRQAKFSGLNGMLREGELNGVYIENIEKHQHNFIFTGYPDYQGFVHPPLVTIDSQNQPIVHGLTPTGFHSVFSPNQVDS